MLNDWLNANPNQEYIQAMLSLAGILVITVQDRDMCQILLYIHFKKFKIFKFLNELPAITKQYYVCMFEEQREVFAASRIYYHNQLLRFFSPLLFDRLKSLEMDAELYAWDWFAQFFMSIFSVEQCCVLLDLIFSLGNSDSIFVCLSVAIIDQMRSLIMRV